MTELALQLDADSVEPGDPITGTVRWQGRISGLEVLLRWETAGKGTKDTEIVERTAVVVAEHEVREARFELVAPERPFSFSGTLISLTYYVRVEHADARAGHIESEIVIAPGGTEVRLARA